MVFENNNMMAAINSARGMAQTKIEDSQSGKTWMSIWRRNRSKFASLLTAAYTNNKITRHTMTSEMVCVAGFFFNAFNLFFKVWSYV